MLVSRRLRRSVPYLFSFAFGFTLSYLLNNFSKHNVSAPATVAPLQQPSQFLVVLVLSSVRNRDRRETIRETWANELDPDVKLYFVISGAALTPEQSSSIAKEEKKYSDLLVLHGIEDSFHSLTLKVLSSFLWLTGDSLQLGPASNATLKKPFGAFSFVLKCDDDSYVRIPDILRELRIKHVNKSMLYWGFFDGRAKVKKAGKYKELAWNICDSYLPYALGGGYILGEKPIQFIAQNAKHWRLYQSEDTSVGAWLANVEGLQREHDPRFDTEYLSRGCHQSYLVTHKHSVDELRKMHTHLITTGWLCPKEYRTRLSYRYEWNAPPSKCCLRNNPSIP